jgi:hypothetical protein
MPTRTSLPGVSEPVQEPAEVLDRRGGGAGVGWCGVAFRAQQPEGCA